MNRTTRHSRITLIVLFTALLWPHGLLRAQGPTPSPSPIPPKCVADAQDDPSTQAGQKIKLYYMRQAGSIVTMLNAFKSQEGSRLKGILVANNGDDEIVLYGPDQARSQARRIIATLDLPRPGIFMEMWGLQMSSRNPRHLAEVMTQVRKEIDHTQVEVREFYSALEQVTKETVNELDPDFTGILQDGLFYNSALSSDHSLSLADILLRLTAAKKADAAAVSVANNLQKWVKDEREMERNKLMRKGVAAKQKTRKKKEKDIDETPVLARFFSGRGLRWNGKEWESTGNIEEKARQGKKAILQFAFQYGRLVHQPQCFSAYYLQHSAEILNTRLQAAIDALNLDIQEMFVAPTLERISEIVRMFDDVEYAQVGKTNVASLSGIKAQVTSSSVNAFDVTPPLRLSELLSTASKLSGSVDPFVPNKADNVVGAMPLAQVIGLIGALGEERSVWRELQSGVSLEITPNVLRNMTSAELAIIFKTGDPQVGNTPPNMKPLSRVSKHEVTTSIYVDPLDFFDLSAFTSQSTLNGGRGYVPIIGPVWRGIFGEIPVAGDFFSWKRSPQTVFSESVVLTTSFITPTAMGIAVLYPTELIDNRGQEFRYNDTIYDCQWKAVSRYNPFVPQTEPFAGCRPKPR